MGDEGLLWRAVKEERQEKQRKHEEKISPIIEALIKHPQCIQVGDHWRLARTWDFWWTGTVFNIKNKQRLSVKELANRFKIKI